MVDQFTYDLLKRLHEFPCSWDKDELEYGRFEAKYRAIYGNINQIGKLLSQLKSLGYLNIPKDSIGVKFLFTQNGFDAVREYENALMQNSWKEQLEIELAKSNIEANKLNAKNAEQNKKDSRFNKIFQIINAVFAAINIAIAILQLIKPAK
jgi:hypothetical protein